MRQAFNIKHGIRPLEDFSLPGRAWGEKPLASGPLKGVTLDTKKLFDDYLTKMGWDTDTATPTEKRLKELKLDGVAKDMKSFAQ